MNAKIASAVWWKLFLAIHFQITLQRSALRIRLP